jgi:serine phosphatase RsbU (regulator of sigma subunit)/CHASE2 domain-containing sensor protein
MAMHPGPSTPDPLQTDANSWSERRLIRLLAGGRGRPLGIVVLAALLACTFLPFPPAIGLRLALFDAYQNLKPRRLQALPASIVAIDEKSLSQIGQWPWPRTVVARIVGEIARAGPAAIGIDVLFPEPDRMSPQQTAALVEQVDPALARKLRALPGNDALLARAIGRAPVVLGMAGLDERAASSRRGRTAPFVFRGGDPRPFIRGFASSLRSLAVLDEAASGHALLSVDPAGGIVRRVPLIAAIDDSVTPALAVEMLRVAAGAPVIGVSVDRRGVRSLQVGDLEIPTEPDGAVWVHFSPREAARLVSAVDVLEGRVEPAAFDRRLVLVGVTGLGLVDHQATPLGVRMPGIEIHAQLLENIFEQRMLRRPSFAPKLERGWLLLVGALLIAAVPAVRPRTATAIFGLQLLACLAAGFGAYAWQAWLLDAAWPALGTTVVFATLLGGTLADTDRQRRALARALAIERDAAARAAGELEAARRIQVGMLPPTSGAFHRDRRFELEALLDTAKMVGGDLYDYFKPDPERLYFAVGDVSGKGLPASIFMAVSKALYKSVAMREGGNIGATMRAAQAEIARDNPEAFFVTLFAGLLDLSSGHLEYCNAGHETPLLLAAHPPGVRRLSGGEGPPLCVLEDFEFRSTDCTLAPGETLCVVTDGVTEAMDSQARLYGRARLEELLSRRRKNEGAGDLLRAIRRDVESHAAGAERSDDITILVLKWNGGAC